MLKSWRYYKDLVIDHNKVDSNLPDYPIVVKLDSSNFDFSRAQSTGNDVRFVLPDRTILKYEREQHDSTNQKAVYHVKIPTASSSVDTIFYMYYGNPSAVDGADPTNVWDSNYKFVSHMNDNPDSSHIADSTINANNGTKYAAGQPTETDGIIGKAQSFDGSNDYINNGTLYDATDEFTAEMLIRIDTLATGVIWAKATEGDYYTQWNFSIDTSNKLQMIVRKSTDDGYVIPTWSTLPTEGTWYYITGVKDASNVILYVNGDAQSTLAKTTGQPSNTSEVFMGAMKSNDEYNPPATDYSNIAVCGARFSNTSRGSAQIKANDYNLRLNTLLSYGVTRANTNDLLFAGNF